MTVYVVTGHPRSGTSMMMAALRAGGMTLAYSAEREAEIEDRAHDQASGFNPSGVWELYPSMLRAPAFPAAYDGQVVKLVWDWLRFMKPYENGYRVLCMVRHPEEVHQSFEATMGGRRLMIRHNYVDRLHGVVESLEKRKDVSEVVLVEYSTVLAAPNGVFESLASRGWPLDWEAAAEIPDERWYRFRVNETIVEGA